MIDETVLEWSHPDQTRRVVISRRANGLYSYAEEVLTTDEDEDCGPFDYWKISHRGGGLYASALDAQNDARLEIAWLDALLRTLNPD